MTYFLIISICIDVSVVLDLIMGVPSSWLLYFIMAPHSLSTCLITFWHDVLGSLGTILLDPSPGISHFFKELWFFLVKNGIRNQDRGGRCAYWGVADPRPLKEQT